MLHLLHDLLARIGGEGFIEVLQGELQLEQGAVLAEGPDIGLDIIGDDDLRWHSRGREGGLHGARRHPHGPGNDKENDPDLCQPCHHGLTSLPVPLWAIQSRIMDRFRASQIPTRMMISIVLMVAMIELTTLFLGPPLWAIQS